MAITAAQRTDILRLVTGMFDAAPGNDNLATLSAQFEAGQTLPQMAVNLAAIPQFTSIYATSLSNAQFVDLFHTNLVGGEVAAAPLAWARTMNLGKLDSGISRGQMMLESIQALAAVPAGSADWGNARAALEHKTSVANHYSVTKMQSSPALATLQAVLATVSSNAASVSAATTAIDNAISNLPGPGPGPGPVTGSTFTLTANVDQGTVFAGTSGNDTFNATYDGAVTDTLNLGDILAGNGGTDTLNISHIIDVAITPSDALWTGLSSIEKVVLNTTGNGAQTLTAGSAFAAAFVNGVDFTTITSGAGAINITLTAFTGPATLTTTSTAGAQTILTGAGTTEVYATSTSGALNIQGSGLSHVTAVTSGGGSQTLISTSTGAVTVKSTMAEGALVITTGSGNDTITLLSTNAAGTNLITGNAGADTITLATGPFAAAETIVIGNTDSGLTVATADKVVNFVTGVDFLKLGTAGVATAATGNYVEASVAVASFAAALTAANAALATLNNTSLAVELYAFQFDASNGYLFNDTDSNGIADQVIILVGINNTGIAAGDIIA